jgi:hypothetical protein
MTPEAIARETARLNARLTEQVRELAQLAGISDPVDQLAKLKSNPRRPAEGMLVERRILVAALEDILPRLSARPVGPVSAPPPLSRVAPGAAPNPVVTLPEPEPEPILLTQQDSATDALGGQAPLPPPVVHRPRPGRKPGT